MPPGSPLVEDNSAETSAEGNRNKMAPMIKKKINALPNNAVVGKLRTLSTDTAVIIARLNTPNTRCPLVVFIVKITSFSIHHLNE